MIKESIANGFKLRLVEETKRYKDYIIEYLKDGDFLFEGECKVRVTSPEELNELRRQLLLERVEKLGIKMDMIEGINASSSVLGVINDFKIRRTLKGEKKSWVIEFLESGIYVSQYEFKKLNKRKLRKIKQSLMDSTRYNLAQVQQCRAICLPDFAYLLDQIVENC